MTLRWFFPAWHGDFRLEPHGDKACQLLITKPTAGEVKLLRNFLADARKKKWTNEDIALMEAIDERRIVLDAPVDKVGLVLVKATKPTDRTLTAVSFHDGKLEVAETGVLTTLVEKAVAEGGKAAVSVARPTPSCPACEPGAVGPASEVLLSFLTPQQHEDWATNRALIVQGNCSGHRYLLAHRNSDTARRIGRICYDLDDQLVLHFHDLTVPAEEEVLAAMLILGHREPWLRNEATVQWYFPDGKWADLGYMRYKNPFGDHRDGVVDAALTTSFGMVARAMWELAGPKTPKAAKA